MTGIPGKDRATANSVFLDREKMLMKAKCLEGPSQGAGSVFPETWLTDQSFFSISSSQIPFGSLMKAIWLDPNE